MKHFILLKSYSLFFLGLVLSFSFFYSCKKNDNKPDNIRIENKISGLAEKIGVSSIQITNEKNLSTICVFSGNEKNINGFKLNFDGATFKIKKLNHKVYLNLMLNSQLSDNIIIGQIDYVLNEIDKTIFYSNQNLYYINSKFTSPLFDLKTFTVLILYNEIVNPYLIKHEPKIQNKKINFLDLGGCDRTIITLYNTKSESLEAMASTTASFLKANPDCRTVAGVDTGCLWGDYLCISTQGIHCSGRGCNVPFGKL